MKSHFFAYISRMRFIQRWALMRNTAPENVQEHSHQVAVLAHALAVIHNEKFGGCVDPGAVTAAALYHDASEILTGDMPTPIKYDNPTIQSAYKEVEAVAERKLLELLPPELRGVYKPILTAGQGGGQALRLYQVRGGAQGRKPGVSGGCGPDPADRGGLWPAGGRLFPGYVYGQLFPDAGPAEIARRSAGKLR